MLERSSLEYAARSCGGQLKGAVVETLIHGVSSDSRRIRPGEIFVALQGDHFDGHDYLQQVAERGAAAAIVSDVNKVPQSFTLPVIEVNDTLRALQEFATNYRQAMLLRTVAVTGSNGKTSTKEMVAHAARGAVLHHQDGRQSQQPHRSAAEPAANPANSRSGRF